MYTIKLDTHYSAHQIVELRPCHVEKPEQDSLWRHKFLCFSTNYVST